MWRNVILVLSYFAVIFAAAEDQVDGEELEDKRAWSNVTRMLESLMYRYDHRLRPNFNGPAVEITCTMNIDSIGPITEVEMKFRVDISFRQYWTDPRLTFSDNFSSVTLNDKFLEEIWQPDTFFPESYESKKQKVMVPNIQLQISPNGEILLSSRVTVIGKCPMDLQFFPMDVQVCKLKLEAYGYTVKDVSMKWHVTPVEYNKENLKLAQFELIDISTHSYRMDLSTGNFSGLIVAMKFKRSMIYFIIQIYLPASLIVFLSWVNFWVNRGAIPARAALAITTVLTMMTLIGSTNSSLPRVSTIKALDVYFAICFLYVFGALLEFAVVCYFNKTRFASKSQRKKGKSCAKPPTTNVFCQIPPTSSLENRSPPKWKKLAPVTMNMCQQNNTYNPNAECYCLRYEHPQTCILPECFG